MLVKEQDYKILKTNNSCSMMEIICDGSALYA